MSEQTFTSLAIAAMVAFGLGPRPIHFLLNIRPSAQAAHQQAGRAAGTVGSGGRVENGLRVFIEAQQAPIPEGQPIPIVFHVTNVGAVNFDFARCRNSWEPNFNVRVTNGRGEAVSRSAGPRAGTAGTSDRIAPGKEYEEVGDLRDQYSLGPGIYYVTAVATLERIDGSPAQTISNTIRVTVTRPRDDPGPGLKLVTGAWPVFNSVGDVSESLRLTNSGDRDVELLSEQDEPWFHNVTLDFRTLSGEPVPRKRDRDGREVRFGKEVWGLYAHSRTAPGPLRPGDYLDGGILLYKAYDLIPGTAYTLAAHVTLQTSDGAAELVSNTVTFVIRAN